MDYATAARQSMQEVHSSTQDRFINFKQHDANAPVIVFSQSVGWGRDTIGELDTFEKRGLIPHHWVNMWGIMIGALATCNSSIDAI